MHVIAVADRESRASGTGHTPVASYKVEDIAASRSLGATHIVSVIHMYRIKISMIGFRTILIATRFKSVATSRRAPLDDGSFRGYIQKVSS